LMSVLEQSQRERSTLTLLPTNGGAGSQGQLLSPLSAHSLQEDDHHII
jgi:hypothetical protein